ncbi:MAG: Rieske (2Fe-2S) protein [Zoogloeaceae bacterium]|nr:Rieske (2Fe-2S) protein [Rhodocyclaceae bacterium]MCP5235419.1 Rieske (2Fe-2S) protein [Zoogloeaceae bacterium]
MNKTKTCMTAVDSELGSPSRRRIFKIAAAGFAAGVGFNGRLAQANSESAQGPRVVTGDRLVEEDAEGEVVPLKASDLTVGRPMLAFPYDAAAKHARTDSRLNKVVLLRLPEEELDADSKALAAGGVLAFSAICTHQGCDLKTWMKGERVLACFCHSSKFDPLKAGKVVGGPAPRALPVLPLRLEGDEIVVAGEFTAAPGAALQ